MFRTLCTALACCALLAIAIVAPPPIDADTSNSSFLTFESINAPAPTAHSTTADDLDHRQDRLKDAWNETQYAASLEICHSFPAHAFDATGGFTSEFLNSIYEAAETNPAIYGEPEVILARRSRSKSFHRVNRSGGISRSRCSGGFCRV